jgi:heme exporter protein B
LIKKAWLILKKDIKQEFATRYTINSILLFSVVTLTAVSFSIGAYAAGQEVQAALLWIIIFFSSMSGLAHIFVREEETHTADTLKLLAPPTAVYLGKLLFNIVLLFLVETVLLPLFLGVMNLEINNLALFLSAVFLGSLGVAAGGTIIAAIISKANSKGALFTVLAFPILLPVLISAISATRISLNSVSFSAAQSELQAIFAYTVVIITASVLLFDFIWKE